MNQHNSKTAQKQHNDTSSITEPVFQVVLHNDETHTVDYVVVCLQSVFAHNVELAAKIMIEAHQKGRAIAEVEAETSAMDHRDQLRAYGLVATVEPVLPCASNP